MRKLFLVLCLFVSAFSQGDTLEYSADVDALDDGDTFFVSKHWRPLKDSIQQIINGRLGNVNISTNANIRQIKIDSTYQALGDWLYAYTRSWLEIADAERILKSQAGMVLRINDSTALDEKFVIVSDSTDTLFSVSTAGISATIDTLIGADTIASATAQFDKLYVDSLLQGNFNNSYAEIVDIVTARLDAVVSVSADSLSGRVLDVDSITFDGGSSWLNDYETGSFPCTLGGVTATVFDTAYYTVIGNSVSLWIPGMIGTSNATSCAIYPIPDNLQPTTDRIFKAIQPVLDNGGYDSDASSGISTSTTQPESLFLDWQGSQTGFTASGDKGLQYTVGEPDLYWQIEYQR